MVALSLADLLAPVTPEQFATEYWGRRALHVTGPADRFAALIDDESFAAALALGRSRVGVLHPADPDEPLTAGYTQTVGASEVDAAVAAGRTVCVTDLSNGSPALAALAETLRAQLGTVGPARFNAFLSPPGSGADLHIDARVTTSLQVQGRKEWWFGSRPAVDWPRSNVQRLPTGEPVWMYPWCGSRPWEALAPVSRAGLEHVVLEPGDLLCLPAGTWHAARAVDRSFALNLSFSPPDVPALVAAVLGDHLGDSQRWRGDLPPSPGSHTGEASAMHAPTRAVLVDMLTEAAAVLERQARLLARGDPSEVEEQWRRACGRR